MPPQTPPSPANKPRIRRARVACEYCHGRKVRCDAMVHGFPCTNCRLDNVECLKWASNPKSERRPTEGKKRSRAIYGSESEYNEAQVEPCTPDVKNLPFAFYSFLDPSQLASIEESEVSYLDSEGCLHLPRQSMIESLINHYFRFVHPCLPFMDEGKFWNMYRRPKRFQGQFSLLLFRAMLFAAAPFLPSNTANGCGFTSPLALRNNLYRKARLLFFHGNECNLTCKSQAALLLSFHNSDTDAMCNSSWLSISIKYADIGHSDRSTSSKSSVNQRILTMKKLWWCCFARDRVISLGMRRPVQIKIDNCPFLKRKLSLCDFEDEMSQSEAYGYDTKKALASIFLAQCDFSHVATDLLTLVYPEQPSSKKGDFRQAHIMFQEMMDIQLKLSAWYLEFATYTGGDGYNVHYSSRLFSSLLSMYYQSARMALCNHANRLIADYDLSEFLQATIKSYNAELCDAVTDMTESFKDLADANMVKYLPASALACTVFPLILWGTNVLLSSTPADRYRNAQNFGLLKRLNQLNSNRFNTKRLSVLIGKTFNFFRSKMVDIAMRYSGASFSDIFEKNPQIYVELYLYLDGLIAENRFPLGDGVDTSSPLLIPYQGEEVAHSPQLGISGSGNLYGIQDEGDWETVSFPSNMNGCSDIEDALPRLMEQNEESNSKLGEDFFDYLVFLGEK